MEDKRGLFQRIREDANMINLSEEMERIRKMSLEEFIKDFDKSLQQIHDNQYGKKDK